MAVQKKITRRTFFSLALLPTFVDAKPLVDFNRGLGLFSDQKNPISNNKFTGLELYNDPEPELRNFGELKSNQISDIQINKKLNLHLVNSNTKEEISFQFPKNYKLSNQDLSKLNFFLKDWRTNEIKNFDKVVLNDFIKVCLNCSGTNSILSVNVHSGFRSKKTNEYLRRNSHKVAQNSMHILGKAIDFSIPSTGIKNLAKIVRANTKGGVGSYQTFVHLDSGPHRTWS